MRLIWLPRAQADLVRLHQFLAPKSRKAATNSLRSIRAGVRKLLDYPRRGERMERYDPREVRRFLIVDYEVQYELTGDTIFILRIWHTREER
ncbi:MAG TPA: type II toxin-antitoxin system RelE/ParE family toxin [Devosia sp.]|nr:type II toxin-antitoxin system RelE/ParE family toxin [Devosia sp.]